MVIEAYSGVNLMLVMVCAQFGPIWTNFLGGELSDYQAFEHSYFYRTHTAWNKLPIKLREILDFGQFKRALRAHIWHELWKTLLKEACDEIGATHLTDLVM